MGQALIGTSGYSYDDWKGLFYPEALPKQDRLGFYSLIFPFVELDFSYYRMPDADATRAMAEKTPKDFRFAVKAHKSLTHEVNMSSWKGAAEAFIRGIAPLSEAGKLACALIQFPYSFHYNDPNRYYLGQLADALTGIPLAIEFRNAEWSSERVREEARKRGIAIAGVDLPSLTGLPGRRLEATADFAYLRFHGRNEATWWTGDATSRYDYLYEKSELEAWVPDIENLISKVSTLYVSFNNHHKAQAVQNAKELMDMLKRRNADRKE